MADTHMADNIIIPPQQAPAKPLKPKKALWVIVVLMVLAVIVCVWYWQTKKSAKPVVYNKLPEGYKTQAMDIGKAPEGFPRELILSVGKNEILRAEDTNVATGQNYKIVDVQTTDQADSLAGLYRNTLTNEKFNWQLISSNNSGNIIALIFKKEAATLTVTIIPKEPGSQMNLSYITQK